MGIQGLSVYLKQSLQKSREGHLPASRQFVEMAYLLLYRGLKPSYYHAAGLWRREIPWRDKRDHLGSKEFSKRLKAINPMEYRKISQNKIVEKALLTQFRLPTARFLGYVHPEVGKSCTGVYLRTSAELDRFLQTQPETRICFKEVEGWGGRNFQAVEVLRLSKSSLSFRPLLEEVPIDCDRFCTERLKLPSGGGWLIEAYLEQHPVLKAINPSSFNTIRIWIIWKAGQDPQFLGAFLRVGRTGSLVDNVSSGGFGVEVNLETGILSSALQMKPVRTSFSKHPDHHAQIEGVQIPFWQEAKVLAAIALQTFPEMRFSGLDIGITTEGPVVVELNPEPDWITQARFCIPMARFVPVAPR
jgi:hypothetical protein